MKARTLAMTLLAAAPLTAGAHDLVSLNGRGLDHQHVYQPGPYGAPLRQGHYAKPAGSNGIVIWSPAPQGNFGTQVPFDHVQFHGIRQPPLRWPQSPLQRQFEAEAQRDSFGGTWPD